MSTRIITTWELSHCGHRVTVWWFELGRAGSEKATWDSFAPIQPWQVTGVVTALRAGVPVESIALAQTAPVVSLVDRALDLIANVVGRISEGRSMVGGRR